MPEDDATPHGDSGRLFPDGGDPNIGYPDPRETRSECIGGFSSLREAFYPFHSRSSELHYQNEYNQCIENDVPRKMLGDDGFHDLLRSCGSNGVKWVFTEERQLYIVPYNVPLLKDEPLSPENSFEPQHSFAAGNRPCICAGQASYDATSKKVTVTNYSGHYWPTKLSLWQNLGAIWFPTGFDIVLGELKGERSLWPNGVKQSSLGWGTYY